MPRPLKAAGQLLRLLETSPRPIYLIDHDYEMLFCNPACAEWTAVAADELVGQRCRYHAPADESGAGAAAARLCPPPDSWAAPHAAGRVAALRAGGRLVFRQALFMPLAEGETAAALLVVVAESDLPADAPPEATSSAGPADLHAALQALRHRLAGRYALDRLLGPSAAMTRVRAQVQLASAAPANVLIVGPAGSGTEHVAKAIHYRQPTAAEQGLVPVDCSTLAGDLLAATLETYFAKAAARRPDAPATLLLRDVQALPADVQSHLVRLLKAPVELRLLSTARQPLTGLVAESLFRADLTALLSTLIIDLPPLAERIDDLPLLAQMFLEEINAAGGRQLAGFASEAFDCLAGYSWPGNIDELALVVADAHAQAAGPEITLRDLPKQIHLAADAALWPKRPAAPIDLTRVLEQVETELIQRALERAKGNKSRAAELLGLTRPRLYRRLVQLGLNGDEPVEFEEAE